ncbi:glutamic acid-rich protein isoform X1 [Astyanax mexicanus]|uniref:glutamic acid-rich protein isoform X1 n=2 Tax=Astyanax mexicanus TaxID=7994 RepID=UPI0020CAEB57|nr:glutamic acid-rich protein isoform X1 [Astyanax mexicanus]
MRMDLRTDLKSQLRDPNRSSKAALLQSRWQEVSERERRARLHNQKLLQDFQRAQDTLTDLVARTEAMNTIRVEYERYLEQNFPRWQQKLKDKRLLEQRKRIEEHLKACIQQMEEDQRINGGKTSSIGSHSASSISSDPSHPPISHSIPLSRESKEKRGEVHARKPRSTMSKQDNKQNLQGIVPNDSQPLYAPFTWPSEAEPQQSNISKQSKTFQSIHQALNSPVPLPADPRYDPYPVVQQEQPSSGHFPQYLKPWAGGVQSAPAGAPWMGVPVNPLVWKILRMSEAGAEELMYGEQSDREKWRKDSNSELQKHQDQRRRRKEKGSDRSSELDTKSACLSDGHGDSIESSALSTVRNQRRRESQTHRLSSEEKGGVSMGSSSRSDHHPDTSNEKNEISKSSTVTTASNTQVKSTAGVGSSSECVNQSSEDAKVVRSSVMEKMTKQRRRETEIDRSSSEEKGGVSGRSSSRSNHHCNTSNDKNKISQSSTVTTSRASNTQVKSTAGVGSTKHLDKEREQEDNCKEDRITDSPTAVEKKNKKKQKTKKRIKKNEDDLEEEKHLTDQEERVSEDGEQRREEKKEEEDDVGDEEQNEEVKSERLCNKRRKGGEKSEGASLVEMEVEEEEDDDEKDKGEDEEDENGGDKEEEDDDVDDGDGELIEKSEGEEDDDQEDGEDDDGDDGDEDGPEEISVKVKAPRSRQIKRGDESDERGNDSEDAASDSKVNINDSLKDLYKDEETEDEELYDQEIEDDIEDGDDDDDDDDEDDDVVVEKAYPWSRGPAYNHTKYQDDEDEDDVEGLLAPQINIEEHDSDEEKETLNSKDSQSNSEEDRSHRKPVSAPVKDKPKDEPADSDDEFDHFYD